VEQGINREWLNCAVTSKAYRRNAFIRILDVQFSQPCADAIGLVGAYTYVLSQFSLSEPACAVNASAFHGTSWGRVDRLKVVQWSKKEMLLASGAIALRTSAVD
jgi:hypothetical protein